MDSPSNLVSTVQQWQLLQEAVRIGDWDRAVALYAGLPRGTGEGILRQVGADGDAIRRWVEVFVRARDFRHAAECWEAAGELVRAAALYEQADAFERAAELYRRLGATDRLAACLERLGRAWEAAELYEAGKHYLRAALCYENAGEWMKAGILFAQVGKREKAVELLERVPASHPHARAAAQLMGEIFLLEGLPGQAEHALHKALAGRKIAAETAEIGYLLARVSEAQGDFRSTHQWLTALQHWNPTYRNVQDWLEDLGPDALAGAAKPRSSEPTVLELPPEIRHLPGLSGRRVGLDFLRRVSFFSEVSLEELQAFFVLCEERVFQAQERLIEQGQTGWSLFVLREGRVSILRVAGDTATEVARLGAGDHVGEMALIDEGLTSARVVAIDRVVAFEITRDRFLHYLSTHDRFAVRLWRSLARALAKRLRETTARLANQ